MMYNEALIDEWLKTSIDSSWFSTRLEDVKRLHQHFEERLATPPIMDAHINFEIDITPLYEEGIVDLKELIVFWSKIIERKQSSPQ